MNDYLYNVAYRIAYIHHKSNENHEAGKLTRGLTVTALLSALAFLGLSKTSRGGRVDEDQADEIVDVIMDDTGLSPHTVVDKSTATRIMNTIERNNVEGVDISALKDLVKGHTKTIDEVMKNPEYKRVFGDQDEGKTQKAVDDVFWVGKKHGVSSADELMAKDRAGLELTQALYEATLFTRGTKVFDEAISNLGGNPVVELLKTAKKGNEFYEALKGVEEKIGSYDRGESDDTEAEIQKNELMYQNMLDVLAAFLDAASHHQQNNN